MAKRHPANASTSDFVDRAPYRFVSTVDLAITPEQLFEVLADADLVAALGQRRSPR